METLEYCIEVLSERHNKKIFSCGVEALDRYLQQQASQDARRYVAATFVLIELSTNNVAGYYTLSSASIESSDLPQEMLKKLPRYSLLPATLLGRLAVNQNYKGKKLGELLLIDALKRSLKLSQEIASMAVIVDAKNDAAIKFYQHYGFIQFLDCHNRLYLPMSTIKQM